MTRSELLIVLICSGVWLTDCQQDPVFPPDRLHFEMLRTHARRSGWVGSLRSEIVCVRANEPLCRCDPGENDRVVTGLPIELRLDLNSATPEDLEDLPGVGPAIAERIVDYRNERLFERVDELLEVSGIGVTTFRRLQPLVRVVAEDD